MQGVTGLRGYGVTVTVHAFDFGDAGITVTVHKNSLARQDSLSVLATEDTEDDDAILHSRIEEQMRPINAASIARHPKDIRMAEQGRAAGPVP